MLPEGLMRAVPPGGNSAPLGLPGEGQPGREGCYIFTLRGRRRPWRPRETDGNPWEGGTEATRTHGKNSDDGNCRSFIYLRVQGQGFHRPEVPEAGLLSAPRGASVEPTWSFCRSFWEASCLRPGGVPPTYDLLGRRALEGCISALPTASNQRGDVPQVTEQCLRVCVQVLSGIVSLGTPPDRGFAGIFFCLGGRAQQTEELNWIFVEWGRGNTSSLVELRRAVGGCLFPIRRDVVC